MLKRHLSYVGFLAILCHVSLFADGIGLIVSTDGAVTGVDKAGASRTLSRRSPVFAGDTIKVPAGGAAQIKFSDSSMMSLSQNTSFRVDSYKNENKDTDEFSGTIEKGTMRTLTGAIAKSSSTGYKVKTPVAAMGVRGTFYACHYDDDKEHERCEFFQGAGFLQNAMGRYDLGADERFSYGEATGSKSPSGYLAQSDSTYDSPDVNAGGEGTEPPGTSGMTEDSFDLESFTDSDLDSFQNDIDDDSGMMLLNDELDTIEQDIMDPEEVQTELTEDGLEESSS